MDKQQICVKVMDILVRETTIEDINNICFDSSLEESGLDSIGLVDLVVAIEKEFNFEFNEAELDLSNFESINKIADLIKKKL